MCKGLSASLGLEHNMAAVRAALTMSGLQHVQHQSTAVLHINVGKDREIVKVTVPLPVLSVLSPGWAPVAGL